jgi:hypothetical protein
MIAGVTFIMPILAVDNIPQRTFFASGISSPIPVSPATYGERREKEMGLSTTNLTEKEIGPALAPPATAPLDSGIRNVQQN